MDNLNFEKIKKVLDDILGYDTQIKETNLDVKLIDDLGFTSITFMELIVELEIQFEIEISVGEFTFEDFNTVGKLVDFIVNKKG